MILLIDMDGVLTLFNEWFIMWVEKLGFKFDKDSYLRKGAWDIFQFIITSLNKKKIMDLICSNMNFWDTIPVDKTSIPIMKELYKNYDLYIATAPWNDEEDKYKISKIKWMKKYFNFIDSKKIIFSREKWTLNGDVIIEDRDKTIDKCNSTMYTICRDQPYNKNCSPDYRFTNWNTIPNIIHDIEKKLR